MRLMNSEVHELATVGAYVDALVCRPDRIPYPIGLALADSLPADYWGMVGFNET